MRIFLAVTVLLAGITGALASEVGDDGLHKQAWFATTFRDIQEDMATAKAEGKRLALIFEQRGCIYCRQVHEQVLTDPEVRDFIKANYMVVQYNLYGDEEVTDLDGETLTEKTAARKWRVTFTPTIFFMPEETNGKKDVGASTVAVMPGAFRKGTFLDMFQWVHKKGYETDEGFQRYHARRIVERREAGEKNTD
ncbi:thioredoxin fold domain-containing protein [Anderseniella sp. Alg231-50]|uniref:thioredoxin fold domain-containing protein n=1 Tax=Anderseniella sp. Alg231-50 TaxID=1922226 RepID=UPI000D54C476